jgi:outer membrane biosynthesis protein TonB
MASLAGDRRSPLGLIGAVTLHIGVIAATMFTWAHRLDIADETPPVVPVELVTIGEKTDIAPMVREQPKTPPKEELQTQPEPPQPQPQPQDQAEAAPPPPDQAPSEPLIKAPPPPPTIVPKFKPQPAKPEAKKDKFDINNIMALLDKQKAASNPAKAKIGARNIRGVAAEDAATMDLVDSLRNQIAQCWSPPVGAPNPDQLVVVFDLFLNSDGSVAQPPQLAADSAAAAASDPYVRAAAEAARRAIFTCAPYKLPANRYSQWREINPFIFDPRQMAGQ